MFFFYVVHSRIYGYELLPSLVSARKVTFGSTVSCKWTRQLHHLDFINSSVRLNWGLFRHSISYMASLWRRNTTDTPTLHRINNVCCAVARRRKILPEVYALFKKSFRDVSEMSIFDRLSQKNDSHLNLLGKMNLPTPCWKNWNSFDRYASCFNFAFSLACYKIVRKLTHK